MSGGGGVCESECTSAVGVGEGGDLVEGIVPVDLFGD